MTEDTETINPPIAALRASRELSRWFDNTELAKRILVASLSSDEGRRIDWARMIPFFLMHLACVAVFWVGFSWVAHAETLARALSVAHIGSARARLP